MVADFLRVLPLQIIFSYSCRCSVTEIETVLLRALLRHLSEYLFDNRAQKYFLFKKEDMPRKAGSRSKSPQKTGSASSKPERTRSPSPPKATPKRKARAKAGATKEISPTVTSPKRKARAKTGATKPKEKSPKTKAVLEAEAAAVEAKRAVETAKRKSKEDEIATRKEERLNLKEQTADILPRTTRDITNDLDGAIETLDDYKKAAHDTIFNSNGGKGSYAELQTVHKRDHQAVKKHVNNVLDEIARKVKDGDKAPMKKKRLPDGRTRILNRDPFVSHQRTTSPARGSQGGHVYGGHESAR